jgi:hypothetical protein
MDVNRNRVPLACAGPRLLFRAWRPVAPTMKKASISSTVQGGGKRWAIHQRTSVAGFTRGRGSLCAGPSLAFDVVYVFAYVVVLSQQGLQWSLGPGRPNFHFDGFFPLLDDVLGLLIKVDIGTKHYREQLFNLLQFSYPALFSRIPPFCIHVLP